MSSEPSAEDLKDMMQGSWNGWITQRGRRYPITMYISEAVFNSDKLNVTGYGTDPKGQFRVQGTVDKRNFDLRARRGWQSGTVDWANWTLSGSYGVEIRRFDGQYQVSRTIVEGGRIHEGRQAREHFQNVAAQKEREGQTEAEERKRHEIDHGAAKEIEEGEQQKAAQHSRPDDENSKRQELEKHAVHLIEEKHTAFRQRQEQKPGEESQHDQIEKPGEVGRDKVLVETQLPAGRPEGKQMPSATSQETYVEQPRPAGRRSSSTLNSSRDGKSSSKATVRVSGQKTKHQPNSASRKFHVKISQEVDWERYVKIMTLAKGDSWTDLL